MLIFKEITTENIQLATKIQMKIFPNECAYERYYRTIRENKEYSHYYLVYKEDKIIGITGLYSFDDINKTNTIWLGWFGVIEKYRKKDLKKILSMTINKAQEFSNKYPIKYFRLYTSTIDNPIAQVLYKETMDICEKYNNKEDVNYNDSCLIYSKALNNNKIEKWDNRFINLKGIINDEEKGYKKYKPK